MRSLIRDTDVFILQRPSTYTGGKASSDVYRVSAEQVGTFMTSYANLELKEIKEKIEVFNTLLEQLDGGVQVVYNEIERLSDKIESEIEPRVQDNKNRLDEMDQRFRDTLARAKINFYHKLLIEEYPSAGEMSVFSEDDPVNAPDDYTLIPKTGSLENVAKIRYHAVDEDGIRSTFDNVFEDETIELTCFSNTGQTLSHRAIYKILSFKTESDPTGAETYYDVKVEIVKNTVISGIPVYDDVQDNPVRSDFYPIINTVTPEEIEGLMDLYMPLEGDHTKTGKLTLTMPGGDRAKITFEARTGVDFVYKALLKFKDINDYTLMSLGNDNHKVNIYGVLDMKNNQIKNIPTPSDDTDAVNRKYVDEALEQFDVTADDLFQYGDRIASTIPDRTEVYGFYVKDGNLFFKTGDG